jgi:hypothetical protein
MGTSTKRPSALGRIEANLIDARKGRAETLMALAR